MIEQKMAITKYTMVTLEEWINTFSCKLKDDFPGTIFDLDGIAYYLNNIPNIGGYMTGPVGMYNSHVIAAVAGKSNSLKEIGDAWINFNGLIFPYMLTYTPSLPQYSKVDTTDMNLVRIIDDNGNPSYNMSEPSWLIRYGQLLHDAD